MALLHFTQKNAGYAQLFFQELTCIILKINQKNHINLFDKFI